jgi:hypothetical protein
MNPGRIPYDTLLAEVVATSRAAEPALRSALPPLWLEAYKAMSVRPTDVVMFTYDSFDYWFDAYQDPDPYDPASGVPPVEARLVAAVGISSPKSTKRDDPRLRGVTLSAMPEVEGAWDRGHFIGHAIGGTVDGNEANVFLQLRSANRGRYRRMERYCLQHPGVLCFSRPIYIDASAHPARVEFGVLTPACKWWVDLIPNR